MANNNANQTIIIKKIKKDGHGHHGGAWKVAYADFVTAMMAFFLLLWLLNVAENEDLSGIADYFAPTIGLQSSSGIGFKGGKESIEKDTGPNLNANKGIIQGAPMTGPIVKIVTKKETEVQTDEPENQQLSLTVKNTASESEAKQDKGEEKGELNKEQERKISSYLQNSVNSLGLKDMIEINQTVEGLVITIKDPEGNSLFIDGAEILSNRARQIVAKLSQVISYLPNYVAVNGHSRAVKNQQGQELISEFEISSKRANQVRKTLISNSVPPEQIVRVVGKGNNEPLNNINSVDPVNDYISILLIKSTVLPYFKKSAPDSFFYHFMEGEGEKK